MMMWTVRYSKRMFLPTSSRKTHDLATEWRSQMFKLIRNNIAKNDVIISVNFDNELAASVSEESGARAILCSKRLEGTRYNKIATHCLWSNYHPLAARQISKFHAETSHFFEDNMWINPDVWPDEESRVKLVGFLPPFFIQSNVQQAFLLNLHELNGVFAFGRVACFILVNNYERDLMMGHVSKLRRPWRSLLYKLFFDSTLINKIGLTDKSVIKMFNTKTPKEYRDSKELSFMKIIPKKNIFVDVMPRDMIQNMFQLLSLLDMNRRERLIPFLEGYLPGIGVLLIEHDYAMNTLVKDIDFSSFDKFYRILRSFPGYESSGLYNFAPVADKVERTMAVHLNNGLGSVMPEVYSGTVQDNKHVGESVNSDDLIRRINR